MSLTSLVQGLTATQGPTYHANVPIGKQIRLYKCPNGENPTPILENKLILGEDLVLNVASQFSPIMNANIGLGGALASKMGNGLSNLFKVASSGTAAGGKFAEQSIQIWESTSPLSFSITVSLYMDFDAKKDVMDPTRILMQTVVPSVTSTGFLIPPGPSASKALLSAATTLNGSIGNKEVKAAIDALETVVNKVSSFTTYKIGIGNYLYLDSVMITRAEPILSSDVDEGGFPIWAKVRLDIQTTTACTTNMIDGFKRAKNELTETTTPVSSSTSSR